jgi:hypothetical protein
VIGGGTRSRFTMVSGGDSAEWVWRMLVAIYVWGGWPFCMAVFVVRCDAGTRGVVHVFLDLAGGFFFCGDPPEIPNGSPGCGVFVWRKPGDGAAL